MLYFVFQSNVAASNAKLSLFYDWIYFDPEKDSIMNIGKIVLYNPALHNDNMLGASQQYQQRGMCTQFAVFRASFIFQSRLKPYNIAKCREHSSSVVECLTQD